MKGKKRTERFVNINTNNVGAVMLKSENERHIRRCMHTIKASADGFLNGDRSLFSVLADIQDLWKDAEQFMLTDKVTEESDK